MTPNPPPNFTGMTDAELAQLYRKGIPGVLEILYDRHCERFRRQARGIARRDHRFTEDHFLNEHYIQLRCQHASYDPGRASDPNNPWQPWASTLLYCHSATLRRRGTRVVQEPTGEAIGDGPAPGQPSLTNHRQQIETSGHEDLEERMFSREPAQLLVAEANELSEAIARCAQQLPDHLERPFLLRQLGLSNPEIAEMLGLDTCRVSARVHQARCSLEECLHRNGYPEIN